MLKTHVFAVELEGLEMYNLTLKLKKLGLTDTIWRDIMWPALPHHPSADQFIDDFYRHSRAFQTIVHLTFAIIGSGKGTNWAVSGAC